MPFEDSPLRGRKERIHSEKQNNLFFSFDSHMVRRRYPFLSTAPLGSFAQRRVRQRQSLAPRCLFYPLLLLLLLFFAPYHQACSPPLSPVHRERRKRGRGSALRMATRLGSLSPRQLSKPEASFPRFAPFPCLQGTVSGDARGGLQGRAIEKDAVGAAS